MNLADYLKSHVTDTIHDSHETTIRAFLANPLNKNIFLSFFRMAYSHSVGYLRYLKSKGFRLPLDQYAGQDPIADLAIDILGTVLHGVNTDPPYPEVFSYFSRIEVNDPDSTEPAALYDHFLVFLRVKIRQGLGRLRGSQNPQLELLKRRVKEVLSGPTYGSILSNNREECIFLTSCHENLREDHSPLPYEELLRIAEEAYLQSTSRTDWCRKIFERVNESTEYCNMVAKHELLAAVVSVNARYVDADGLQPTRIPGPEGGLLIKATEDAIAQTLNWLDNKVLDRFVRKGRIDSQTARQFRAATHLYLSDMVHSGETDPVPQYFREVMPENEYDRYLEDYKYVFETTISETAEYFRDLIKNNRQL